MTRNFVFKREKSVFFFQQQIIINCSGLWMHFFRQESMGNRDGNCGRKIEKNFKFFFTFNFFLPQICVYNFCTRFGHSKNNNKLLNFIVHYLHVRSLSVRFKNYVFFYDYRFIWCLLRVRNNEPLSFSEASKKCFFFFVFIIIIIVDTIGRSWFVSTRVFAVLYPSQWQEWKMTRKKSKNTEGKIKNLAMKWRSKRRDDCRISENR